MSAAFIPVEECLRSGLEPDAEYVDGAIEERFFGTEPQSAWQVAVSSFFWARSDAWGIRSRFALHIRVAPTRYRIADVAGFDKEAVSEPIPSVPPLLVAEILSPEDRMSRLRVRLADFAAMGVQAIYVVEPEEGTLMRRIDGGLPAPTESCFETTKSSGLKSARRFGEEWHA